MCVRVILALSYPCFMHIRAAAISVHKYRMFRAAHKKQGSPSGTVTRHATSGNAALASDIEDSHGPVTERAASACATKDLRLQTMFREACSKAPPNVQRLLQEVNTLGHYPKRYKHPADKVERASDSLAKKIAKAKGHFTSAVQKYLAAMQVQAVCAVARADALMQQVRKLGHLPRESQSEPQEHACTTAARRQSSGLT